MSLILKRFYGSGDVLLLASPDAEAVGSTMGERGLDEKFRWLSGLFEDIGGIPVLLFRHEGVLYLRVGGRLIDLAGVSSRHTVQDEWHALTLIAGGEELMAIRYPKSELPPWFPPDLVLFTSDEDWDFGLFIHNVLANPERRRGIWKWD